MGEGWGERAVSGQPKKLASIERTLSEPWAVGGRDGRDPGKALSGIHPLPMACFPRSCILCCMSCCSVQLQICRMQGSNLSFKPLLPEGRLDDVIVKMPFGHFVNKLPFYSTPS